jgi:hypothetical protein
VPGARAEAAVADTVPPPAPPGKISLSVAAASTTEAGGRGRRVSCSIALAVAGAFAAVSVGSVFVFGILESEDDGNSDSAGPAPTANASSSEAPGDTKGDVPATYLGTWEGDGYALDGKLPAGTFRVTLKQATVGKDLGTFRSVDPLGGACDDKLVLKEVTDAHVLATSIADTENNPGTCTSNTHVVTLTLDGDALQYAADNADAGDPTARLKKLK